MKHWLNTANNYGVRLMKQKAFANTGGKLVRYQLKRNVMKKSFVLSAAIIFTALGVMAQVKDINVNEYKTVKIGDQEWMASNLNVSMYRNGDTIPEVKDPVVWKNLTTGAWCYYNNDPALSKVYGKLYNWYAVNDPRGLAPEGWQIPSNIEWFVLVTKLGGPVSAAGKMKATGFWQKGSATNSSGLSLLPGGGRYRLAGFGYKGVVGCWWSATENVSKDVWTVRISADGDSVLGVGYDKRNGFSVRCFRPAVYIVKELDRNNYKSVKIGNQVWMVENLNVSRYRNGDSIPEVRDPVKWKNLTTGAWCYYGNNPDNGLKYGKLYNWYAVTDPRGLAPAGWHVPSLAEWEILDSLLGIDVGVKLKSTSYWYKLDKKSIRKLRLNPDSRATNSSGFTALPGGYRHPAGSFFNITTHGQWWSRSFSPLFKSRHPYSRSLDYNNPYFSENDLSEKLYGYSVRCIRD